MIYRQHLWQNDGWYSRFFILLKTAFKESYKPQLPYILPCTIHPSSFLALFYRPLPSPLRVGFEFVRSSASAARKLLPLTLHRRQFQVSISKFKRFAQIRHEQGRSLRPGSVQFWTRFIGIDRIILLQKRRLAILTFPNWNVTKNISTAPLVGPTVCLAWPPDRIIHIIDCVHHIGFVWYECNNFTLIYSI